MNSVLVVISAILVFIAYVNSKSGITPISILLLIPAIVFGPIGVYCVITNKSVAQSSSTKRFFNIGLVIMLVIAGGITLLALLISRSFSHLTF